MTNLVPVAPKPKNKGNIIITILFWIYTAEIMVSFAYFPDYFQAHLEHLKDLGYIVMIFAFVGIGFYIPLDRQSDEIPFKLNPTSGTKAKTYVQYYIGVYLGLHIVFFFFV